MKRKFILLPITLTALAPAISLVGCGNHEESVIEVDVNIPVGSQYIKSEQMDFDGGKTYQFKIDLLVFGGIGTEFGFWFERGEDPVNEIDAEPIKVMVNDHELIKDRTKLDADHYVFYEEDWGLEIDRDSVKSRSDALNIYIKFNKREEGIEAAFMRT